MGRLEESGHRARGPRTALALCLGSLAVHVGLRVFYFSQPWRIDISEPPAFVAAEGIVGLMAKSILDGARPVFYWGQFYLGSFEAYLAACAFQLFGVSMTVLRSVAAVTAFAWIPLSGALAHQLYGWRAGLLAAALTALPAPFVFEWGFIAWGGHAHSMFMLLELLLLVVVLRRPSRAACAALGFSAGFSVWVNQLAAPYLPVVAGALYLWGRLRRRDVAVLAVAAVIGVSPLVYGNVVEPLATARNLGFRIKSSWRLSARLTKQQDDDQVRFYQSKPLFQVLGAQPRRDGAFSPAGAAVALLLALGALGAGALAYRSRAGEPVAFHQTCAIIGFVAVSVILGISGFFGQPVGRYQVVLYPLLGALLAGCLDRTLSKAAVPIVAVVVIVQMLQLLAPVSPDGRTPVAALVSALTKKQLYYGYAADYAYDVVFVSNERVLVEPLGWSKQQRYADRVAAAQRVFYLYRDEQTRKVSHRLFMDHLARSGTRYDRFDLGEYHVLFDFDPRENLSGPMMSRLREQIFSRKDR